jgi:hypothetical protein
MTTATRKIVRRRTGRRSMLALNDHRFYALLIYRLSLATLATIVLLTLGR